MKKGILPVMLAAMVSVPMANTEDTGTVTVSSLKDQTATAGPEDYFTGAVRIDSRFNTTEPAHGAGGTARQWGCRLRQGCP